MEGSLLMGVRSQWLQLLHVLLQLHVVGDLSFYSLLVLVHFTSPCQNILCQHLVFPLLLVLPNPLLLELPVVLLNF